MKSSVYVQKNHTKEKFKKIAVIALAWAIVLFTVPGCESTSELKDSSANFTTATSADSAKNISAARGQGIRITVPAPVFSSNTSDDNWIPQVIQDTLTSSFAEFSSMTVIDRKNEDVLKAEQKHSEEAIFSDVDAIELGKVTQAQYIVAINIINTNSSYSISFRVLDTSTNEIKASYNNAFSVPQINAGLATKAATKEILPKLGVELTEKELATLSSAANAVEQQKIMSTVNLAKGMDAEKNNNIVEAMSYYVESGNDEAILRFTNLSNYVSTGNIREDAKNDIAARKAWLKTFEDLQTYFDRNLITLSYDINPGKRTIDYKNETVTIPFSYDYAINSTVFEIYKKIKTGLAATGKEKEWTINYNDFKIGLPYYYVYFTLKDENGKILKTVRTEIDSSKKWSSYSKNNTHTDSADIESSYYWFTRTAGSYSNSTKNDDKLYVKFKDLPVNSITDKLEFGIEKITVNEKRVYNKEKKDYEYVSSIKNPPLKVTVIGIPEANSAAVCSPIKMPAETPVPFKAYNKTAKGPAGGRIFWADKKGVNVNGKIYHFMEVCPVIYGRNSGEKYDFTASSLILEGEKGAIDSIAGIKVNQSLGYGWEATNNLLAAAESAGYGLSLAPVLNCTYGGYSDWYIPNDEEQKLLSKFIYHKAIYHLKRKSDVNYIFTFGGTKSYDRDSWTSGFTEFDAPFSGVGSYDGHYSPHRYEAFMLIRLF